VRATRPSSRSSRRRGSTRRRSGRGSSSAQGLLQDPMPGRVARFYAVASPGTGPRRRRPVWAHEVARKSARAHRPQKEGPRGSPFHPPPYGLGIEPERQSGEGAPRAFRHPPPLEPARLSSRGAKVMASRLPLARLLGWRGREPPFSPRRAPTGPSVPIPNARRGVGATGSQLSSVAPRDPKGGFVWEGARFAPHEELRRWCALLGLLLEAPSPLARASPCPRGGFSGLPPPRSPSRPMSRYPHLAPQEAPLAVLGGI